MDWPAHAWTAVFWVLAYLSAIAAGFGLFVALFQLRAFAGIGVLFYRGVLNAAISALALLGAGTLLIVATGPLGGGSAGLDARDVLAAAALSFSVNVTILIVLPVTIDRSVTVFLLGQLGASPDNRMSVQELTSQLHQRYVDEYGAVQRRLAEQERSGNVERDGGSVRLTRQGRRFLAVSRVAARLFRADARFLEPPGGPETQRGSGSAAD